ncbi:MAG: TIGR03013 family PEP-CTERM/XrtA system glycosyltransferase [Inhella sp.]|jgi:sugar transferase (PEP-CTERM system associated)|uniref:TIGR03013 family XrtA/PEP-CTERM system glycosyltransferase n=1 Tax=Inhella sp. TaxID=1921806 RepID=UPI0022C1D158|nr:TIGR03013 family XrtA/PEP-CTERM system glycosyltransferase [Inhella sp.]MCZ8236754.1 TIGR03013 family PEP-CTERM/XrtA system glycosyltransferase [Inhella sp.]
MVRVFNHYLQRRSLMQVIFDVGLIVAVLLFTVLALGGGETLPVAAAQSLSLAGVLFVVNSATGLYQPAPKRTLTQVCMRGIVALMFALPITFLVLQWLPVGGEDAFWVSATAMAAVAAVVMHRALASRALQSSVSRNRVLVLGAGPAAWDVAQSLREADPLTEIIGFYPGASETEVSVDARELVSTELPLSDTALRLGADEIVVALSERRGGNTPLRELLDCKVVGIRVVDLATHFEKNLHQISLKHVNAGWLVFGDGFNQTAFRSGVKRAFDLVCSAVLLVVSAPAMLVAAMAVKLESPGPVFYRQERVGLNGVPFMVTKFRSMRNDAEKDGRPVWATKNDARVTRVGKFIRKTRIDELPQLFNVLRGDMSLVGPRPERAFFVEQLIQKIPYFAVRHSVKPGVTGWAQVKYDYGATEEDAAAKLQYDLYYVKNHSLFLDILVLIETVAVVLTGRGAR